MDEESLINKSKEGDEKAFAELIEEYQPKIFAHILSMVKSESSAEDLTQESFIAAYRNIATFQKRASFFTWLWRIAHNKALGWLRSQKKEHVLEFKEEIYYPPEVEEEKESISELLQFLPKRQEIVYRLFELENLSQKEIASQLNIPLGTVRSRIHYARKNLIKLLSKINE